MSRIYDSSDLTGVKFDTWTVIKRIGVDSHNCSLWECICNCGNVAFKRREQITKIKYGCSKCSRPTGPDNPSWRGAGQIPLSYWSRLIRNSKSHSRSKKQKEFTITINQAWKQFLKQGGKCALSGMTIDFKSRSRGLTTASLDRIDSSKGYIKGNIQWLHKDVNNMKQSHPQHYFVEICKKIADYCV